MPNVVGVRFKRAGRVYYFDPAGIELEINDRVIVQTSRGLEVGWVVISAKQVLAEEIEEPLKSVLRKAEPEDLSRLDEMRRREREAMARCEELIAKHQLAMKLLSAEYSLDGSRLTFCFCSENRVDFRQLLKDLTSEFKTRVELRQVGPRDEAKIKGGFGRCGRPLCCTTHLCAFSTVSIKMAKEQGLPLNPMKISGVCGRLLCCLSHESEQYREMRQRLPGEGQEVMTPLGKAKVVSINPLKETVFVELESEAKVEIPLSDIKDIKDHSEGEEPPRERASKRKGRR